jgi:hypothetical protein
MRFENFTYKSVPILMIFVTVLSLVIITSPVFATSATAPSSPITVKQGGVFLLRGSITFDQADTGYFEWGPVYWYSYGQENENFVLENTPSVYWTDGTPVENIAISDYETTNGWQVDIGDNGDGIARNGTFYIDIWLRAASGDGTLHAADNEDIYFSMDQITMFEPNLVAAPAGPITIQVVQVLGRSVDVSISQDNQSGAPGSPLTYIVTVMNTGSQNDNYDLTVSDDSGWTSELSQNKLENIGPGEKGDVTLTVTVPEDAENGATDSITITAASRANPAVSDSAACIATATEVPPSPHPLSYPTIIVGVVIGLGIVVVILLLLKRRALHSSHKSTFLHEG